MAARENLKKALDSGKAKEKLNWKPKTSFEEIIHKIVQNDIKKYHEKSVYY